MCLRIRIKSYEVGVVQTSLHFHFHTIFPWYKSGIVYKWRRTYNNQLGERIPTAVHGTVIGLIRFSQLSIMNWQSHNSKQINSLYSVVVRHSSIVLEHLAKYTSLMPRQIKYILPQPISSDSLFHCCPAYEVLSSACRVYFNPLTTCASC